MPDLHTGSFEYVFFCSQGPRGFVITVELSRLCSMISRSMFSIRICKHGDGYVHLRYDVIICQCGLEFMQLSIPRELKPHSIPFLALEGQAGPLNEARRALQQERNVGVQVRRASLQVALSSWMDQSIC